MRDEVVASTDGCVKCTICEQACPVAAVTDLFPGPKYVGPQAERFRHGDSVDRSVEYCSGCGACSVVCPQGVAVAELNIRARAQIPRSRRETLRNLALGDTESVARLAGLVPGVANALLGNRAVRRVAQWLAGVHRLAPLPAFAPRRSVRSFWTKSPGEGVPVVYFPGCSTSWYEPWLGEMVVAVLERNGISAQIAAGRCCGLPAQSNGFFGLAARRVARIAKELGAPVAKGTPVLASSTSCALMLMSEAKDVLGIESDPVLRLAEATWDVSEFLLDLHRQGRLDQKGLSPISRRVYYHPPCQQRRHLSGRPALELLALIPGVEIIESTQYCCGIAGTYGLKAEKYEVAMEVGRGLFSEIADSSPEVVACDSETCRWQITHASGVPSVHPVELLYESYGLSGARRPLRQDAKRKSARR